jgi:hypothetical protein
MIKEFISRDRSSGQAEPAANRGMPASYSERVSLHITDPRSETPIIDHLFERYQTMRKMAGQAPAPGDGGMFHRFITESYDQIAGKYRCKQVAFEFHTQGKEVSITASPVEEAS